MYLDGNGSGGRGDATANNGRSHGLELTSGGGGGGQSWR